MIILTVNDGASAKVYAMRKADGGIVWESALSAGTYSSPIALYGKVEEAVAAESESNAAGEAGVQTEAVSQGAWIVQGDDKGALVLLNAATGEKLTSIELGSGVVGSPSAFNGTLVVATQDGKIHGVTVK